MRVAIVENTEVTHLGQVGVALAEAGAVIRIYRPFADGVLPGDDDSFDALVVFGGEQNALADATHPYLPDLARLMRTRSDASQAVLGICLGSQILARAYGAENHIGTAPEFGWHAVSLTESGLQDPVLGALAGGFPIFQWHSDTFTLPAGAVHLATTAGVSNQAFRIGRACYGTQFHFEANSAVVTDWRRRFPDGIEKVRPGWVARHQEEAARHAEAADAAGLSIARAWVALI